MIIYDNQESPKQTAAVGSVVHAGPEVESSQPPPSYSEATGSSSRESDPLLPLPLPLDRRDARRLRRRSRRQAARQLCKSIAIVFALLAFAALSYFVIIRSKATHKRLSPGTFVPITDEVVFCLPHTDWKSENVPPDNLRGDAANLFSAHLDFPVEAHALFFLASSTTAPQMDGSISFSATNNKAEGVRAAFVYHSIDPIHRDAPNICLLKREDRQFGLGFLDTNGDPFDSLPLGINIIFPPNNRVRSIESNLSRLFHAFVDPDSILDFDNITVRTSNATAMSSGIRSKHIDIRTTNGAITGIYGASGSLSLYNTNSFMDVDINMSNLYGDAHLSLTSNESPITAKIQLSPDSRITGTESNLSVNASTTKGHVKLSFDSVPLGSVLHVNASAPQGSSFLNMPRTYEGRWEMTSRQRAFLVDTEPDVDTGDPAGFNRTRRTIMTNDDLRNDGIIWWGKEEDDLPNPVVLSSDSMIQISASEMAYLHFV